jgi:hypothetical protein
LFIYQNSIPPLNFESSLAKLAGYTYYVPSGIYLSRKENPMRAQISGNISFFSGLGLKFSLYNLFNLSILLWFGLKFNKKGDCGLFPQLFAGNQPNKH